MSCRGRAYSPGRGHRLARGRPDRGLAGRFMMKGSGYGMLGDIMVGLIGSLLGGNVLSFFVEEAAGFWGSIIVAFIGACVLIFLVRTISGRRAGPSTVWKSGRWTESPWIGPNFGTASSICASKTVTSKLGQWISPRPGVPVGRPAWRGILEEVFR